MPGPIEKGLNGWMAAYSKSSLIIIKDTAQLNLKDEVFVQHIEAFEASLGPSLKSLGHITDTTRHLTCLDNVIDTSAIAQYLPPCLPCVEDKNKKYEVLAVTCSLEELEAAAEACGLLVPIAKARGLFPKAWDIHPTLNYIYKYFNWSDKAEEDDAKHYFKKELKHKFKIKDEFTGTPFTSAQCQLLTALYLNNKYNKFKKQYGNEEDLDFELPRKGKSYDIFHRICPEPHVMEGSVYKEGFMLHDQAEAHCLANQWKCWGVPPMKDLRAYLGEKVGFTLAWKDCWVKWGLILPAIFGLISFCYGLVLVSLGEGAPYYNRFDDIMNNISNINDTIKSPTPTISDFSRHLIVLLDNPTVPYYALFMCIWSVVGYIRWQRVTKLLQFEWGVSGYTLQDELERPGYRETPLEDVFEKHELGEKQGVRCIRTLRKILAVLIVILLLSLVVGSFFLSLYVKFKLREVLEPNRETSSKPVLYWIFDAQLIAQIASGSTSAVCIFVLRQVFNHASYKLTIFENHMFESDFERSLTWKLFAMDFVNTHFYNILVMFFRGAFETDLQTDTCIFNFHGKSCDLCMHDDCISTVSINVFMILLMGFVMDQFTLVSFKIKRLFHTSPQPSDSLTLKAVNNVQTGEDEESQPLSTTSEQNADYMLKQVENEFHFIDVALPGDTNSSYDKDYSTLMYMLRKMQMYTVVVMYAAACPLAPVIVLLLELLNNVRDRARYTGHLYRRPVAQRTDGIGHWLPIQSLVNLIGLTSNAFIIALRSRHGKTILGVDWSNYYQITLSSQCDPCNDLLKVSDKGLWVLCLWLIVIMALVTQALTNYFDYIPVYIKVAMRKQKFVINKVLYDKKD